MDVTRRYWGTAALAGLLTVWAVVLAQPFMLIGAAGIAAWLLSRQYQFVRLANQTVDQVIVTQRLDRTRVSAEETTVGTIEVDSEQPLAEPVQVTLSAPVGSTLSTDTWTIPAGTDHIRQHFEVTWPIAGAFEFEKPTLSMTDSLGLFRQTAPVGAAFSVTVEPRVPSNIHIGEGGDRIAAGFGEHDAETTGGGLTPAKVRKYVAGDSIRQMDWKATARLGEPHIREFEAETDLKTVLIVDHRATMATGRDPERKLDFAKQVAIAFADSARDLADPLACYTVGDGGLTRTFSLATNDDQYRSITRYLRSVEPTTTETTDTAEPSNPARTRQITARLSGTTPFETKLRPFFEDTEPYVQRIANQPLFAAVQTAAAQFDGTVRAVIVTDDKHRTELLEAVKLARRGSGRVVVCLTPTTLYEPRRLGDIETAYERYTEFEDFRRELAALDRVTALEVGPADRLAAILNRTQKRSEVSQ